jgi:hypothetical protein
MNQNLAPLGWEHITSLVIMYGVAALKAKRDSSGIKAIQYSLMYFSTLKSVS